MSILIQFSILGYDSDLCGCHTLDRTQVLGVIVISLPLGQSFDVLLNKNNVFWDTLNKSLIAASNNS